MMRKTSDSSGIATAALVTLLGVLGAVFVTSLIGGLR